MPPTAAPALFAELIKIAQHPAWSQREKIIALAELLMRLFVAATEKEQLAFNTLFARISYAGHKFNFQPDTLRVVHFFRRVSEKARANPDPEAIRERDFSLGIRAVAETILVLTGSALPPEVVDLLQVGEQYEFVKPEIWDYKARARVVAVRDDADNFCLVCLDEEMPERPVRVRYNIPDRNENFNRSIQSIRKTFGFPVTLNLLDVDIDRHGEYRPRAFVIEPDFLVDVSAIAECFKDTGAEPLSYLVKKFLPYEVTPQILLGNIANHFLDRLMTEPDADWRTLLLETFQLYPFVFAPMSDREVKDIADKSQRHFQTIRQMTAGGGFAKEGIDPAQCFLEPSFFSEQYGLQGRLDLFFKTEEKAAIVELKGGASVWKPNSYGISRSHFTQTLLYDLLVRSVFGARLDPAKYILYSGQEINQLRFAPTVPAEQMEAMQLRNQLVAIERRLANIRPGEEMVPMLLQLKGSVDGGKGFLARDFAQFETVYSGLSELERKYFNSFVGFVAREQMLAKTGEENGETLNGNAALWRGTFAQKQEGYCILSHLELVENQADAPDPQLVFRKTELTNPLANFRVGDIALLYPAETETDTVLESQIIRCNIVELGKTHVRVQLRYRQFNRRPFEIADGAHWHIEPDMMENGFANMHRSLFEWAGADKEKRARLLTAAPPSSPVGGGVVLPPDSGVGGGLTDEQAAIFQKIIASQDYFLLWGPPGTGKTSVMLRALAEYWLKNTQDNLLLLAYTNRAVDEICEALESILVDGGRQTADGRQSETGQPSTIKDLYLRIGSRFSTAERFRGQLLNAKIAGAKTRKDLQNILQQHRIFVGTVASFAQNDGVLRLKKFQRLVVDEASQLLEPQLIGLLSRFDHFTLIGDHRQLPAITVQRPETTLVPPESGLHEIGLTDLRDSYFERLYRRCEAEDWHWAFARLSRQGRMHTDIMDFPNRQFYGGFLQTLSPDNRVQTEPLGFENQSFAADSGIAQALAARRVVFLPVPAETSVLPNQKSSRPEAAQVAQLVVFFKKLWAANGRDWRPSTLGIITPWRAQIAQIRQSLAELDLDPDELTIDTVERYQGGARDIILISTCANSPAQLSNLVSRSAEGVDRKLNVALTRARQHVVVVGNPDVLRLDERYRAFMDAYGFES
ncbi:MAG: DEAD/DEAH box helicase [Saprospiraceae bacterium]